MIATVFGTTGELIKLAPVLRALQDRDVPGLTLCTGQQTEQIPALLDDFGLPQPDVWLARGDGGRDLQRADSLPGWLASVIRSFAGRRRALSVALRSGAGRPLVLVHGDTMTTVLGALMGRALGAEVAHLEAGLRSGNWRHPFPEELDRRAVSRLARLHLAPNAQAAANLRAAGARGEIVDTGANTIRDALALARPAPPRTPLPEEPFGVVSLHRFELLGRPAALRGILDLLQESSRRLPLVFIDHPVTAAAIAKHGFERHFDARFRRIPRQRYFPFLSLLQASAFLVTDSGGSQEECAALGHPCLVHRVATERPDGLGGPIVLSGMDLTVAGEFLRDPLHHRRAPARGEPSPTELILDQLEQRGFLTGHEPGRSRVAMAPAPAV